MIEDWSIYVAAGIVGGLGLSMLIFSKWDFPAWLKRTLRLNTRLKGFIAVLLLGTLLAVIMLALTETLQLNKTVYQAIEGVTIGFNCAVVLGLIRLQDNAHGRTGTSMRGVSKRQNTDNRSRRSKG